MSENTRLFPTLQINILAEPIQFVEAWNKYFPFDEDFERYMELAFETDSYTSEELLWLFEYLEGEKISGEKYELYKEEVGSKLDIINLIMEDEEYDALYTDTFMNITASWFIYLQHITSRLPYFDHNVCLAFRHITDGGIVDTSDEELFILYGEFCKFSEEMVTLTPGYGELAWRNALWTFGKFLKEFGSVLF